MDKWLFLSLLMAHIIGDFYLQSDKYCQQKEKEKTKSWFLYIHSLIIGALSFLFVGTCALWLYALIITISHLLIDIIKVYCFPKGLWPFVADQLVHVAILAIVSFHFHHKNKLPIETLDQSCTYSISLLILAVLLCMKPTNILIKLILKRFEFEENAIPKEMKNAGALIGGLERILTIIFVLVGQYGGIGFIITAKSLLRFKDTDTAKTEYVLAGTFLSFVIGMICGLMTKL